ncbi:MAG TPA: DUF2461 domain-containing protein [Bryobacteraceae bacterium]|nr:DUF2461 domain-containing protein [Bryobacteraceae bacterium]
MVKIPAFPGFPSEAIQFLHGLRRNNRREWFQAHKPMYDQHVKAPMSELVSAVNRELVRWAPDYVADPQKAIYRIYRDTRFSSNKTPYKDHIAAIFPRRGLEKHAGAGFYFSISDKEVEVAGGVYMPGPEQLFAIRTHLAEHHAQFRRITSDASLRRLMGDLKGNQLSRAPKGFLPDHPAADLVRYKQWLYYVPLEPNIATTSRLLSEIVRRLRVLLPFVEFLNSPLLAHRGRRKVVRDLFA